MSVLCFGKMQKIKFFLKSGKRDRFLYYIGIPKLWRERGISTPWSVNAFLFGRIFHLIVHKSHKGLDSLSVFQIRVGEHPDVVMKLAWDRHDAD